VTAFSSDRACPCATLEAQASAAAAIFNDFRGRRAIHHSP
jgi:hypothetical protein